MIVRMKHLDLVCVASDKESTLEKLRALGVVHLDLAAAGGAAVAAAKGELDEAEKAVRLIRKARGKDFSDEEDSYEITTAPEDFDVVHKALEEQGIPMASAEVTMIPQTYVTLTDEADITNIGRILDLLDEDDDVQEVYHNWDE